MGRHWAALQWQPSLDEATFARMLPPSTLTAPVNDGDHAARLAQMGIEPTQKTIAEEKESDGSDTEDEGGTAEDEALARQAAELHRAAAAIQTARRRSLRSRGSIKFNASPHGGDGKATRYRTTSL